MPIVEKNLDGLLAVSQASLRFEERPLGRLRALGLEAIFGHRIKRWRSEVEEFYDFPNQLIF